MSQSYNYITNFPQRITQPFRKINFTVGDHCRHFTRLGPLICSIPDDTNIIMVHRDFCGLAYTLKNVVPMFFSGCSCVSAQGNPHL